MSLTLSIKLRLGLNPDHIQLSGWVVGQTGPVVGPVEIMLWQAGDPQVCVLRVALDPAAATLSGWATGGSRHFFRLADATLRPLPAKAPGVPLARGDAYIALSPGAGRLAGSPAIARFLHLRDYFNAERLAGGVLDFVAQESGRAEFPEDVAVLVVEAR